jgi:hypothetical protein
MRHGTFVASPKICGKEFEKEGAAWMEVKWILPMLSLHNLSVLAQKIRMNKFMNLRIVESKCGLGLVVRDLTRDLGDVFVECTADKLVITKNECLVKVKADSNNVTSILSCKSVCLFRLEFMFEQEFLVILMEDQFDNSVIMS